jgi:D-amino-acid dehydrogenase
LAGVELRLCHANLEIAASGSALVPGAPSDLVLVAAGVGSARLMRAAGHRVPLIAERGYHIRSGDFDWPPDLPPLVFEDRSLIVTRFRDSLQVASFVEFGSAEAPPDVRKWERLEQHAAELGLPMRPPFERWMGARPTLPDYLPAIGRSERASNLFYAFGHQHLGLTLAPITAELIRDEIDGTSTAVDLAPFSLGRL